jgi:hypothetical protein
MKTGEKAHPDFECHDFPSSCKLMEDHLVLIFKMRKNLAKQLHNELVLRKFLDILFKSLST